MSRQPENRRGLLANVRAGAGDFIAVSAPNVVGADALKTMARDTIVLEMANPMAEITPNDALPHLAVMCTSWSDFPDQVNNLLAVSGLFRGALDARASRISEQLKFAAAVVDAERSAGYVIPSVFDSRVVHAVAIAVREKAIEEGLARRALFVQDENSMLATAK